MSIRPPVTLPAYAPTRWELRLPDYPIITNSWRSSAFPEILGSLPTGAEWRLEFENMTNAEALALLLPWRATGGGLWTLTALPAELAGGVNNDNFKKRLTGTSWAIAREPQKESVKNGRFNVTIDLIYELTFTSTYGPSGQGFPAIENPLRLNLSGILSVAALPITTLREVTRRSAGPVLDMNLSDGLDIASVNPFPALILSVPAFNIALAAVVPGVSSGKSMAVPATGLTLDALTPVHIGTPVTAVSVPTANTALTAEAPAVSTG